MKRDVKVICLYDRRSTRVPCNQHNHQSFLLSPIIPGITNHKIHRDLNLVLLGLEAKLFTTHPPCPPHSILMFEPLQNESDSSTKTNFCCVALTCEGHSDLSTHWLPLTFTWLCTLKVNLKVNISIPWPGRVNRASSAWLIQPIPTILNKLPPPKWV